MYGIDNEEDIIYLTRGDEMEFSFYRPIYDVASDTISNYIFQIGDKIDFVVKEKNGYTKTEVFRKTFTIREKTPYPLIRLSGDETKWGEISNKRKVFWFDIVLNDEITIVGFNEDGPSKIYLYPEAEEV